MSIRRPAEAAERALSIQHQVTRQETLEAVIVPWLEREAAVGQEWLRSEAAQFPQAWNLAWLQAK